MRLGHPLLAVHSALSQALLQDLPDISYENRDWQVWRSMDKQAQTDAIRTRTEPRVTATRRPHEDDVEMIMFPQTWGSTALGYGGMGGASVTSAYTVIVHDHNTYCVYFGGGECAYRLTLQDMSAAGRDHLRADIQSHNMSDRNRAGARYQ